jgi:hypothetical protein
MPTPLQNLAEKALAFRHGMNRLRTRAVFRQLNYPTSLHGFVAVIYLY